MNPDEMRDAIADLRRHLVGIVSVLERLGGIDPAPPRWCAGCTRCEQLNRQQRDAHFASKKMPVGTAGRGSQN